MPASDDVVLLFESIDAVLVELLDASSLQLLRLLLLACLDCLLGRLGFPQKAKQKRLDKEVVPPGGGIATNAVYKEMVRGMLQAALVSFSLLATLVLIWQQGRSIPQCNRCCSSLCLRVETLRVCST